MTLVTKSAWRAVFRPISALGSCALAAVALAACGSDEEPAADAGSGEATTVSMGFLYDIGSANAWTMEECLQEKNVTIEMNSFTQFADVQRAFQGGEVDIGVMGPQNLGQMVDAGFTDFKAIAGVDTGGEHITLGEGVEVDEWTDFAGMKVGVPPNSFVDMLFRAGATEGGLDLEEVEFVNFPGAGPPMLAALESGAIDAMVAWETNNAQAKAQDMGDYSPTVDLQQGDIGKQTSVMYASNEVIESKPEAIQSVVDCLVARTEELTGDVEAWKTAALERTGVSREVADIAVEQVEMDANLYSASVEEVIKTFAEYDLVEDSTGQLDSLLDYSFLEQATGKSAEELGKGSTGKAEVPTGEEQ